MGAVENLHPIHLPLLRTTQTGTWMRCPRRYRFEHVRGVVPTEDALALRIGTVWHKGMEGYLAAIRDGGDVLDGLRAIEVAGLDPWDLARLRPLYLGYVARWEEEDRATLEVVSIEREYSHDLVNPDTAHKSRTWRAGGRLDGEVRINGRLLVIEHKCLAGSARVFDHRTGTYRQIAELHASGEGPLVTAMDSGNGFVVTAAKAPVPAGPRPIWRVKTRGGRLLRASGNHPVWTQRGWVAVEDLTRDDWLGVPRSLSSETQGSPLSDEAVRLIGYMIGDGCCPGRTFTKKDEAVLQDVLRCATAIGEHPAIRRPSLRAPYIQFSNATEGGRCHRHAGAVAELLRASNLDTTLAADKRIPFHLAFSDHQLGQLLGALWSTDGCIDTLNGGKLRVAYSSRSDGLCRDVQTALQRLGIVSNVNRSSVLYRGSRRGMSTLIVMSRTSRRRFLALAAAQVIPVLRTATPFDVAADCIPDSAQGADSRGQPFLHESIWWDRVLDLNEGQAEETYDLEVPEHHTFVVEGIVTHNTSSLDIEPGSDYWRQKRIDAQASNYLEASGAEGNLYDVVRKVALRPYQATPMASRKYKADGRLYANLRDADETIDAFEARCAAAIAADPAAHYQRGEVVRTADELTEAARDRWDNGKAIAEAIRLNRFPRNTASCFPTAGAACPFAGVCAGETSIDSPKFTKKEGF